MFDQGGLAKRDFEFAVTIVCFPKPVNAYYQPEAASRRGSHGRPEFGHCGHWTASQLGSSKRWITAVEGPDGQNDRLSLLRTHTTAL